MQMTLVKQQNNVVKRLKGDSMFNRNYQLILDELSQTLKQVDTEATDRFVKQILQADKVFVSGKGRSGFVANSFAMRLNQLGQQAYVVGETTTPSIKEGDCLIIVSGSGSTTHLQLLADKAVAVGAHVLLLSTVMDSPIGQLADTTVVLPASTKHRAEGSQQPLGSLFEQSAQVLLDSLVLDMQERLDISEETMQENHANLE
ncbi:SIS domain-containing protein [Staphylococcus muscae]|uniref:SIS domain-containing protein n=2 Tax=Staphylococcus muscae TaxID=1294 RepID=A0A240BTL8_9STAP|nr:SIS domain-containing protein [Staphylococcus muscae]